MRALAGKQILSGQDFYPRDEAAGAAIATIWKETRMDNRSSNSLYDRLGGETGVRHLVEIFYDIVEHEPEGRDLMLLHLRGHGVAHSRIEQFNFLSGFFGGPKLYAEKHGHSNVRKMHEHVVINAGARDSWLNCMVLALDRVGTSAETKTAVMTHFRTVASMLKNSDT